MRVLGSLTALGSRLALQVPWAPAKGAVGEAGAAGEQQPGPAGAAPGAAAAKDPSPPPRGGLTGLLGASAAHKGSLDLADLWEPSLSGFNSRALAGLTQALVGFGAGGAGLGPERGGSRCGQEGQRRGRRGFGGPRLTLWGALWPPDSVLQRILASF
jgi:hypothetical protein